MIPVLVTGGAGYIGAHIVHDLLVTRRLRPVVLDNLTQGSRFSIPKGVPFVRGSIGNAALVRQTLRRYRIQAVLHLAAKSIVSESMLMPDLYWKENVESGLILLQAMRDGQIKKIVFSSSAAVYGEPASLPITELFPVQPTHPYGRTKAAMELLLQDFVQAFGFSAISLRYFNAAGAHDLGVIGEDHAPETHLIPNVLRHALGQIPSVRLYGNDYNTPDGTCIRDYIDVRDVSRAHLLALQSVFKRGKTWAAYNLGSGRGYSNRQVIELCAQVTGQRLKVRLQPRRPGDPARLVAANRLVRRQLGWKPTYGLSDMISSAWKWHSTHPHGF